MERGKIRKTETLEQFNGRFPVVIENYPRPGVRWTPCSTSITLFTCWMETARIFFFEKLGMLERMKETGIGYILKSIECRFRVPFTHPDTVSVGVRLSKLQEKHYVHEQVVFSHSHKRLVAEANAVMMMYDYQNICKAESLPKSVSVLWT